MTTRTLVLLFGCVAGCMAPAKTPSLMPRAIERQSAAVEPVSVTPEARPIDTSLAARIAALISEVQSGAAEFTKAEGSAMAIAAGRGAAAGSEAWIAAEQARSALQAARQRSAAALGELDALVIAQVEAAADDSKTGGVEALRAAQMAAEAIVARQTARLDELSL